VHDVRMDTFSIVEAKWTSLVSWASAIVKDIYRIGITRYVPILKRLIQITCVILKHGLLSRTCTLDTFQFVSG
jgi:hypothetical protein